jgi:hypothetical protein
VDTQPTRGSSASSRYVTASSGGSTRHTTQDSSQGWPPDQEGADTCSLHDSSGTPFGYPAQQQQQQRLQHLQARKGSAPELFPGSSGGGRDAAGSRRTHSTGSSPVRPRAGAGAQLDTSLAEALLQQPGGSLPPPGYLAGALGRQADGPDGGGRAKSAGAGKEQAGGKKAGKKKRRAKSYGNPELLKAERAKADEGLAACLPLLLARQQMEAVAKQQQALQHQATAPQQQAPQERPPQPPQPPQPLQQQARPLPLWLLQSGSAALQQHGLLPSQTPASSGSGSSQLQPPPSALPAGALPGAQQQQQHPAPGWAPPRSSSGSPAPQAAQPPPPPLLLGIPSGPGKQQQVKSYMFDPGTYSRLLSAEKKSWG